MLNANQLVEAFKSSTYRFPQHQVSGVTPGVKEESAGASTAAIHASLSSIAKSLYPKYEQYLGDMKESWTKKVVAIQMENWHRATAYMTEDTKAAAIANFNKDMFPLIRAVLPATATEKCFTIQPMFGPTSNVFVFTPVYGTTTGKVNAGDELYNNVDPNYGDSVINGEYNGTGDGSATNFTFNLSQTPILSGTVNITDGSSVLTDNGSGVLLGDGTGTVDYNTGAVVVNFTTAPASGELIECSYSVNNETNENAIPQIDLVLSQLPVTARRKAIRFRYSLTASFALRDQYGLDADAELVAATASEIAYGIDLQNFKNVARVAIDATNDVDLQFDRTTPSGISFTEYKYEFIDTLIKCSTRILTVSGRAVGNWAVLPDLLSNIVESIGQPRFAPLQVPASRGIQHIGTLDGRWEILRIIDPLVIGLKLGEFLVGHKPEEFLFAGYVWAPWIAAYETPTTVLDDFQARKGMASLYADKVINAKYYIKAKSFKS